MRSHFRFPILTFGLGVFRRFVPIQNPKSKIQNFRRRPGYTLAELLIVILIMVMLVSITLPTVKRVLEDGNVREASRQFNAYIAMAKARALQTGRPCGIMLRCDLPPGILEPPTPPPGDFPLWP